MGISNEYLEGRLSYAANPKFKSNGERKIAYFLESNHFKYQYERPVLVNAKQDKPRIWYPDFYLPGFGSYIEYYGMVGKKSYDRGVKTKEIVYSKSGFHVIPVYPWMLNDNWQKYIMKELRTSSRRQYRNFMNKKYWSQQKTISYKHSSFRRGYHHSGNRRY